MFLAFFPCIFPDFFFPPFFFLQNEDDELQWVERSFLKNEIFIGRLSFRYISWIVINFIDNCHILMAWLCAWLSDCYCFVCFWFGFYVRGIWCTAKISHFLHWSFPSCFRYVSFRALKIVFDENCCTNRNATEVEISIWISVYLYGLYATSIPTYICGHVSWFLLTIYRSAAFVACLLIELQEMNFIWR